AACGGVAGEAVRAAAVLTGRRALPTRMVDDALRLLVEAAAFDNPDLSTPVVRRLIAAVAAGNPVAAALAWRGLIRELGLTRSMSVLAPVSMELLAWNALTDVNPGNDDAAWATLAGGSQHQDPVVGLPVAWLGRLNRGAGRAYPVEPDRILRRVLDRADAGDIVSYIDDIAAIGNHGLVLVRRIECADGQTRHALLMPGTSFARLSNPTPQDCVGVFDNLFRTDTTYTRSACKALEAAGVPPGSEVMLVGHSLGGITALNIAADPHTAATYRITHVVAIGSPIDNKRAADPTTAVLSLANEFDVFPSLDGRGPACPVPVPDSWTELTWRDDTCDFPLCHAPQTYASSLRHLVPEMRTAANRLISPYAGVIVANQPYAVRDR
ncbi:hypothetical protein, partial [Catenulispora yoronensis]|uniref:hypothetical protein n=1 Tax=Catenulispora yoronensis TaxID=450799 RepID=UPI0031E2D927